MLRRYHLAFGECEIHLVGVETVLGMEPRDGLGSPNGPSCFSPKVEGVRLRRNMDSNPKYFRELKDLFWSLGCNRLWSELKARRLWSSLDSERC